MSGYETVPIVIPDSVIDVLDREFPEVTAVMIVSEHEDGSATVSIAGRKTNDREIIATIARGVAEWEPES